MPGPLLKKLLIVPPILVGVAVLFHTAGGRQPPERKPPEELARVARTIPAQRLRLTPRVRGFGSIYPGAVWNGVAQVAGEIEHVHPRLKKGAILPAGAELARISPVDYDLAIDRARANVRSAEAGLSELKVTETNTADLLAIEKSGLALRESELRRKRDLFDRGALAQSALDLERRETLAQRKKVQDLENVLRLLPTQRAAQRERISVYRAELASAELDLERTRIVLPFQARISEVNVEAKQYVQTGNALVTADSLDVAEVEAQVPISQFGAMVKASRPEGLPRGLTAQSLAEIVEKMGFEASVRLQAGESRTEWPARFARIGDAIDPKTRTIGVIVAVDGAYAKASPGERPPLIKGMFVEIEVRAHAEENQLIVPRSALHDGALYVANDEGRLEIRPVVTGLVQGDVAVIADGLAEGERIVVSDLVPAVPGMLLSLQPDQAALARLRDEATGRPARP